MKKPLVLSLGLALCLLLSSCVVTSDNPLSPPETAKPDRMLLGRWQSKDSPDEINIFTIKDEHWMHLEVRKKNQPSESYDLFPTIVGNNQFLNVIELGTDDKGHPTKMGYFIVRYEISPDYVFSTWMMDQDKAAALVRAGKLKGIVHQDKNASMVGQPPHPDVDVTLQDTGENIAKFIQRHGVKALFSDKPGVMSRIEPGGQ